MIWLLLVLLTLMLFLNFHLNRKDILSPAFIFCLSFVFSVCWACLYAKEWELGLHMNTFLVISVGVLEFSVLCAVFHHLYTKCHSSFGIHQNDYYAKLHIPPWLKAAYLLVVLGVSVGTIYVLTRWAGMPLSKFVAAARKYDDLKFDEVMSFKFPSWLSSGRVLVEAGCYWFGYDFFNRLIMRKRFDILSFLIVMASIGCNLLTGQRSGAFNLLLAYAFFCFFIIQKKRNSQKFLSFRGLLILVLIVFGALASFRAVGLMMQRNISKNTMDYLAMYLGAEIKNLDIFLQSERPYSEIWGSQTFQPLVLSLAPKFGYHIPNYNIDLPYQKVNGFGLGNVYTIFYPFIYDFGYFGAFLLVAFMAFLSQFSYEIANRSRNRSAALLFAMIYASMFSSLIFAFFSNKFFGNCFTIGFAKKIIFWVIFEMVLCRIFNFEKTGFVISENPEKRGIYAGNKC